MYIRNPRPLAVKPLTLSEPDQYVPMRFPPDTPTIGPGEGQATPSAAYGSRNQPAVPVTLGRPFSCCQ